LPPRARRIAVIGAPGSGKTTFAERLAQRLGVTHVELDALHWEPNWVEASGEVFRGRVERALAAEAWVADGDYGQIAFSRAYTVVWLDYPLAFVFMRLLLRTARRLVTREELWSGNREPLLRHFTRDSLFLWLLSTYYPRRRAYLACMRDRRYRHLTFVRLRAPRLAETWLAGVEGDSGTEPAVEGPENAP
jgi:adenylate kinase family enzyme